MKLLQIFKKELRQDVVGMIYHSDNYLQFVPLKTRLYGYYYLTSIGIFKFKHYGWLKNGTHILYVKDVTLPKKGIINISKG